MHSNYKAELLAPAGSYSKLQTAILYGADAVYAGTPDLSLRAQSSLKLDELLEGVKLIHQNGRKIYLTLNLFAHNKDIDRLPKFIETIRTVKPDGVIIADLGVFNYVRKAAPELELHVSTQANICSSMTVKLWQELGAGLCVLAREVSFAEFGQIRADCPDIKLEIFVHGAMCMSYSGRCLISNFLTGRASNKGACAHSCRWNYKVYLEEEQRPGEFFPLEEDDKGAYLMSSKDLCLMPYIDKILASGVNSLKIEGRNKTEYYVAVASRAYKQAMLDYYSNPSSFNYLPYQEELNKLQNRGYTDGFFNGPPSGESMTYNSTLSDSDWRTVGSVSSWQSDGLLLRLKNPVVTGGTIQFVLPHSFKNINLTLPKIFDSNKEEHQRLTSGQKDSMLFIPKEYLDLAGLNQHNLPALSVARMAIK
ncbi:MAG: U32 family peptidase [Spirochaetaceae bacterium]|nr:U32 family peptidase [Spirochaetaceae bacterium]